MDLLWIVVGLVVFCMPHLSASAVGVSLAWAGLPYPAELLTVLFALLTLARAGIPEAWKEHLAMASFTAAGALVLFECVCGVFTRGAASNLALSFAGETVHAAAVALWLLHASLGDGEHPLGTRAPRIACALFAVSGVAWYVATAAIRTARFAWNPQLEVALWVATGVWLLPYLVALWACNLAPKQFAQLAAAPLSGALAGNRAWWMVSLFLKPELENVSTAWIVVAPVLACAALAFMWAAGNKRDDAASVPQDTGSAATPSSPLPLQRIPGFATLSEREREVLLQTLEGKSSAQIARDAQLAPTTVRTYLASAFEKLGVSGSQELLLKLRATVEDASTPPTGTDEEDSESFALPIIIAVPAIVIMIVALVVGLLPAGGPRNLVGLVLAITALVAGLVRMRGANGTRLWAPTFALFAGAAIGLVATAVALGPSSYLVRRAVIGLALVALALALARKARNIIPSAGAMTCAFAGLVAACLIPRGIRAQLLIHSVAVLPLAAAMLAAAWIIVRRATNDELAAIASATLTGEERVLAYLGGRGLKELVARVALLTARDYPLGGIAATLGVAGSTVNNYRSRAYAELGVANKTELIELLEKEAGL